jgi:7-carboxy-7-deazaguanine synthase
MESFWSVQGEGLNSGRRALFVRMFGCNLLCPWCDTRIMPAVKLLPENLEVIANDEPGRFAVLTGGEPLANEHLSRVIEILKRMGFYVACESNGTQHWRFGIDFLTVSPKREAGYKVVPALNRIGEFKYVVDKDFDFAVLEARNRDYKRGLKTPLYLSPEFSAMKENAERILDYMERRPWWRLSLQTHKLIGVQ